MTLGREIGLGEGNGTMGVEQEEWRFEKVKRMDFKNTLVTRLSRVMGYFTAVAENRFVRRWYSSKTARERYRIRLGAGD